MEQEGVITSYRLTVTEIKTKGSRYMPQKLWYVINYSSLPLFQISYRNMENHQRPEM